MAIYLQTLFTWQVMRLSIKKGFPSFLKLAFKGHFKDRFLELAFLRKDKKTQKTITGQ